MARIVVILHHSFDPESDRFALQLPIRAWQEAGHEVVMVAGTGALPDADLAILHVDLSVVPEDYAEAARRYPRVVNASVADIRKRAISRYLLARDDEWKGLVIVKSDLNTSGVPELRASFRARGGEFDARTRSSVLPRYRVFRGLEAVPEQAWSNPDLVVEKFLPEHDDKGFYLRTWTFLGEHEICRRFARNKMIIKGADYLGFELVPVPDLLRAERERLGFDYGKFDFVVRDGQPILLDVNKTPGMPARPELCEAYRDLAGGLGSLLW